METQVTLNMKEQKRLKVLNAVEGGRMSNREAAQMLGLSVRQVQRLKRAYGEKGAGGLAHGNRGKASKRRIGEAERQQVVALAKGEYRDYNDQHLCEELAEQYGLVMSRSTVRRIRRAAGLSSPHKRRAPRHRTRRERYPLAGMLVQMDGSDHDWLEGRGPRLCLLAAIDDATSQVIAATFREQEDTAGYMQLIWQMGDTTGLPLALYADRHTIFQSPKTLTLEEELAGQAAPQSQLGRALKELEIEYIPAYSPQAKGRVERLFGTLQDRLVKALRQANACTLEEANQALPAFLTRFNARFQNKAAQTGSAYRPWPTALRPSAVLCLKYTRRVTNDNTLSFNGFKLPLPPGPQRRSFARCSVELHHHLDGSLSVHSQNQTVAVFQPDPRSRVRDRGFIPALLPSPTPLPISSPPPPPPAPRLPHKPAPNHPWRHAPLSSSDKPR